MATALIILSWTAVALLAGLLGSVCRKAFGRTETSFTGALECILLGWCAMLGLLQVWHFTLPVNASAWWVFVILAVAAGAFLTISRSLTNGWSLQDRVVPPSLVVIAIAGVWLALNSTQGIQNYDTGLYHFDLVRWTEQFAIVPGLGNLHGRLAFNSSHFLAGALWNQWWWNDNGHHLTNGFLIWLALAFSIDALRRLTIGEQTHRDWFFALFLPFHADQAIGTNVTGYSPDLPVFVFGALTIGYALELVMTPDRQTARPAALVLSLIVFAGCTLKLSFAIVALPLFFGALMIVWSRKLLVSRRQIGVLCAIGGAFLIPWIVRGFVTSGYPAYPSTAFALAVDWKVPEPIAECEAIAVRNWAREPNVFWGNVGTLRDWLPGWIERQSSETRRLLGAAICSLLLTLVGWRSVSAASRAGGGMVLGFTTLGCITWFWLAPDIRFAGAWLPAILCVSGVLLAMSSDKNKGAIHGNTASLGVAIIVLAALFIELPGRLVASLRADPSMLVDYLRPEIETRVTDSGLVINTPRKTIQTWGMQLPATHLFREDLELRNPSMFQSGFRVTRPLGHLDGVGQRPAIDLRAPPGHAGRFLDGWGQPEGDGTRWMQTPGRILLFAPSAAELQLNLVTGWIDVGGHAVDSTMLAWYANDQFAGTTSLRVGEVQHVKLSLRRGFNLIFCTIAADPAPNVVFRRIKDHRGAAHLAFKSVHFTFPFVDPLR